MEGGYHQCDCVVISRPGNPTPVDVPPGHCTVILFPEREPEAGPAQAGLYHVAAEPDEPMPVIIMIVRREHAPVFMKMPEEARAHLFARVTELIDEPRSERRLH